MEACLNEGLKGSSLGESKLNETISSEESEGMAALSGVILPERGTLSEETMGTNRDE